MAPLSPPSLNNPRLFKALICSLTFIVLYSIHPLSLHAQNEGRIHKKLIQPLGSPSKLTCPSEKSMVCASDKKPNDSFLFVFAALYLMWIIYRNMAKLSRLNKDKEELSVSSPSIDKNDSEDSIVD